MPGQVVPTFKNPLSNQYEEVQGQSGGYITLAYAYQPSTLSFKPLMLDGSGNLLTAGGGGGGGAVTIADGADVAEGSTSDAAVYGDTSGSVSAKLRGLNNSVAGLGIRNFDYTSLSQTSTQDVWTFKTGGSGGTTVSTVTINYTDSTKATITNVSRT